MRTLTVSLLLVLYGCGSPCQQVKATRCNGSVVEACGSNKKWQRTLDCSKVHPIRPGAPSTWICGETASGHTCLPVKAPASAPAGGK